MPGREGYLDNAALEAAIRADDRETVARLLYVLADHVVGIFQPSFPAGLDPDEVIQKAAINGMRDVRRWQPGRSSAFSFATGSVKWTIKSMIRSQRNRNIRFSTLILELEEVEC